MDSCKRDFPAGFPNFCYIFITFVLMNPSNSSIIPCSSVAKPWPHNLKVQGSNPTEAKKFFHSFQIKRFRDSIGCVIQLMIIAKLPWETRARGSNFKIRSTTGCPVDFASLKKGDQIACRPSKSKISKIPEDFEKGDLGIFKIFEKY